MAKNKYYTNIWTNEEGVEHFAKYHFDGSYYPSTPTEPAEFPELVIDEFYSRETMQDVEPPQEAYEWLAENHEG